MKIYNSALDTANGQGLLKVGDPLLAGLSGIASDHFPVFADLEVAEIPTLQLSISPGTVAESDPSGAATLTVSLPEPLAAGETLEVTLAGTDASEAIPVHPSVTFTPGVTSIDIDVAPQRDALLDGDHVVGFTASAIGYHPGLASVRVTDVNTTFFTFNAPGETIVEDFSFFDGSTEPSRWRVSEPTWRGEDDGSSATPGNYTYGDDPSLGLLPDGDVVTVSATYFNNTGSPIEAVEVGYDAEQWRSALGGSADDLQVDLLYSAFRFPLPGLSFTADNTSPSGPFPGGETTSLSDIVAGFSIQPGEFFVLRFFLTPDRSAGVAPDDIFLNEFHYDNSDADAEEFIEVVVAPGYRGLLSNISVLLYNGNGGTNYNTHTLDTFTLDQTTASGHRIFSKPIADIQNGPADAIAIAAGTNVLHFLSYEGVIGATDGLASGLTSTDIGVAQSDPVPPPGSGSLGLTGTGQEAADLTWTRFAGPYTRGGVNDGQTLTAPAGIARPGSRQHLRRHLTENR